jgi:SAM-dependent methyltransferase
MWINDCRPNDSLVLLTPAMFREARNRKSVDLITEQRRVFAWALHDADGRGDTYQKWNDFEQHVKRWLEWYRPHHFVWKRPVDTLVEELAHSVSELGLRTWRRMFRRYSVHHLAGHDGYSLPDLYYSIIALGSLPRVALDIGGGWGRLGMAWIAVGCPSVAVIDSIEQAYILQNAYLQSVPDGHFWELLGEDVDAIDVASHSGIAHFPFWQLPQVRSGSIDVVSAVQVLREVDDSTVVFLAEQLVRLLKPGGVFYVRDNDHSYSSGCMHSIDVTGLLVERGFDVIYHPELRQGRDIHGVPRVFRWPG